MNYLVLEINKEEKLKVQLKSALAGLSISEFLKKAIKETNISQAKPVMCSCGNETEIINKPFRYEVNINDDSKKIVILNMPHHKCNDCGTEGVSSKVNDYLEKVMNFKINEWVRLHGSCPEIIDFEELIKIN